ncbi:uncharacterized protein LOC111637550 [Centruroides sculpturatus]|uniref:uncharacterized protein LOC111637548 n=1 Tax=Centruroides sculpturatus TaxID=218467 RepID=UPI000C6EA81C|nr:uncharacterized protein LOC111637548 [Centruroides sculpturatus]XP_023238825.1 uncharacterized protein LOC111637550 [Centruroides sculpturatus]
MYKVVLSCGICLIFIHWAVDGSGITEGVCGVNELYVEAGCESSCKNLLKEPCLGRPKHPGCICKAGLIREESTNHCISIKECGQRICQEPNRELNLDGRFTVCTGPGQAYTGHPFRPHPVCTCKRGFARSGGICIPVSECQAPQLNRNSE